MERAGKVELLAPAGCLEGFYGAVHAGADAVYLGGSRFGARAYAENFTQEELVDCIRFGKLFGVKVYLTVNTLLKEKEMHELPEYLNPFYQAGLDGVIVQDLGVLRLIREQFPGLKLHASTQMTLCSSHGARLLKDLGVCRIVPARELSLEELSAVKREVDIELETFVHGAMCYCYSGQCLFSSILGGRSGNRGRCAQPCRLPYTVVKEGDRRSAVSGQIYPLSLKDMCTIDHLPALIEAGIDSFKIEGRMKKPEYSAGATAVYRKYIDLYYELRDKLGPEGAAKAYRVEVQDWRILSSLYIRSKPQEGYYFQKNGSQMVTLESPAYNATEEMLLSEIRKEHLEERPKLSVKAKAVFLAGQPAVVTLLRGNVSGSAVGEIVQRAQKQPITEENIRKQLSKLGDSPFRAEEMQLQVGEDAFYPLKQINELRRKAVRELEQKLLELEENSRPNWSTERSKKRSDQSMEIIGNARTVENREVSEKAISERTHDTAFVKDLTGQNDGWIVSVRTLEQLESLSSIWREIFGKSEVKYGKVCLRRVYVDGDLLVDQPEKTLIACRQLMADEAPELLLALPYVLRKSDKPYLERLCALAEEGPFAGFLIRSLDGLGFLRSGAKTYNLRTDAGLYVWNSLAAEELSRLVEGFCIPYELNASEQRALLKGILQRELELPCEKIVYSHIPMMITANCVSKTTEGCQKGRNKTIRLVDRYRKEFPVLINCLHCTNIIYNGLPFALTQEAVKMQGRVELRLDFTLETGEEMARILRIFRQSGKLSEGLYTTGHEKRGVE